MESTQAITVNNNITDTVASSSQPDITNTVVGNSSVDSTKFIIPPKTKTIIRKYNKKVGRNDLCPCGSGKKYKKCCLKTGENNFNEHIELTGIQMREIKEHEKQPIDFKIAL